MFDQKDLIYSFSQKDGQNQSASKYGSNKAFQQPVFTRNLTSSTRNSTWPINENPHTTGYFDASGEYIRNHGLNWFITALFLVGDIAGGGLVALPTAIIQSGVVVGIIGVLIMTFVAGYTSYALGRSWMVLLKQWPEYRCHTRKPYPEIAYRAMGPKLKIAASTCIGITQFGVAVVYLLLAAKNIRDFVETFFHKNLSYCYVIVIVAVVLLPVMFLKSPQDFWLAVVIAMFTSTLAVIFIIIAAAMDYEKCVPHWEIPKFSIVNQFLALGTLIFSYGGHAAFPTIQHDMKRPHQFTKSTVVAFIITGCFYVPICIASYITYGDSLRDSIINSLQVQWIQHSVNMFITVHCVLTLTIVLNPLNQETEEYFEVPQKFGLKRVLVRVSMMAIVVFAAESVPTFGPVLDLVGGSTLTLTSIMFPCMFFLYLDAGDKKTDKKGNNCEYQNPTLREIWDSTNGVTMGICIFIVVFGGIGGIAATFSAINDLSSTHFVLPCYLQPFFEASVQNSTSATNCCGHWQNITSQSGVTCSDPNIHFYN